MARPLRIEYAGAIYHVTSRGDRREVIYINDEDRRLWLEIFGSVCERFNWRCHAWCLMDNHYHIVVETVEGNLSKGMRQLNGVKKLMRTPIASHQADVDFLLFGIRVGNQGGCLANIGNILYIRTNLEFESCIVQI